MRQTVRERRVENDRQPVHRNHSTIDDFEALRGLHPAVGGQDPEGRDQRSQGHHRGREEVHPPAHAIPAKQHDAQKTRFKEECSQYFIGQQRPGNSTGKIREPRPVRAELVGHDQARYNAHAEVDGENLRPKVVQVAVGIVTGFQPHAFEHHQITGETDGNGGKNDVERYGKRELNSGELESIQTEHKSSSIRYQVVEDPDFAPESNYPARRGHRESLLAFKTTTPRDLAGWPLRQKPKGFDLDQAWMKE